MLLFDVAFATTWSVPAQGSLADVVAGSQPEDTVRIEADITVSDAITVPHALVFEGSSTVRAGTAMDAVLIVDHDVTVLDLVFDLDGKDARALLLNAGTSHLEGVTFRSAHRHDGGGAVRIGAAQVSGVGLIFEDNQALRGGGVYVDGGATFACTGCAFTGNAVHGDFPEGGGIHVRGAAVIESSTFSGNDSEHVGGGIHVANGGALEVSDTGFSLNSAYGGASIMSWGQTTLLVSGSTFEDNSGGQGPAIDCAWNSSPSCALTVLSSTFARNTATSNGGHVHVADGGSVVVDASHFEHGSSPSNGGAVDVFGSLEVNGSTFVENEGNSGGALRVDGPLTVRDSEFRGNVALGRGGAIRTVNGALTIEDSTFVGNSTGDDGGGVFTEAVATVERSFFCANDALDDGGGVSLRSSSTVRNTVFALNTSVASGSGARFGVGTNGTLDPVHVHHSVFVDNLGQAQARCYQASGCAFEASVFIGNQPAITDGPWPTAPCTTRW